MNRDRSEAAARAIGNRARNGHAAQLAAEAALEAADAVMFSDGRLASLAVKLRLTAHEIRTIVSHLQGDGE